MIWCAAHLERAGQYKPAVRVVNGTAFCWSCLRGAAIIPQIEESVSTPRWEREFEHQKSRPAGEFARSDAVRAPGQSERLSRPSKTIHSVDSRATRVQPCIATRINRG